MVARARQLSEEEGIHNVDFELADAQMHPFPSAHFTLGISRFGTMFFADPVAAFTSIGRALRSGTRLVQLVWQDSDRQEWAAEIRQALADNLVVPASATGDPFSLADPAIAERILTAAGFTEVDVIDVREPVYYGPDTAKACHAVLGLQMTKDLLAELDASRAERALDRLRALLAAHNTGDGVWFDSCAWLIIARRL